MSAEEGDGYEYHECKETNAAEKNRESAQVGSDRAIDAAGHRKQ